MKVWASAKGIEALQFLDSEHTLGTVFGLLDRADWEEHMFQWQWAPEVRGPAMVNKVRQLTIWDNGETGDGQRISRIRIRMLCTEQEFDVRSKDIGGEAYDIDVNSGLLLGVVGRHLPNINRLGFLFARRIEKVTLSDFEFKENPDELNKKNFGITTIELGKEEFANIGKLHFKKSFSAEAEKRFFSDAIRIFDPPSKEFIGKTVDLSYEKDEDAKLTYKYLDGVYEETHGKMEQSCGLGGDAGRDNFS